MAQSQTLVKASGLTFTLDTIKKKMELTASLPNSDAYGRAWLAYGIYGLIEEWIGRGMVESPSEMNMIIIKSVTPN